MLSSSENCGRNKHSTELSPRGSVTGTRTQSHNFLSIHSWHSTSTWSHGGKWQKVEQGILESSYGLGNSFDMLHGTYMCEPNDETKSLKDSTRGRSEALLVRRTG